MRKKKIGLITSNSERSIIYLNYLISKNIYPDLIVHADKNIKLNILKKLKNIKIKVTQNVNSHISEKIIKGSKINNFIYACGKGIKITRKEILKKNIFHAHPGKLPLFKGSAVFFYSILLNKNIHISVIKLNKNIDEGKIFFIKKINLKNINFSEIDKQLDLERIKCIIKTFNTSKIQIRKKYKKNTESYYIPHPIIRKLAEFKFKKI